MLVAFVLAAAVATPVETGGVDLSCSVTGAHLTVWEAGPNGATRSLSVDAKPGETFVVDRAAWTATAKPVGALRPTEYGFQSSNSLTGERQSTVIDCATPNPPPLRFRTMAFPSG